MSDSPTCGCGLMMSRNPHPSAGYPTEEAVEAGYEWECIPCLVKTRNRVGREMRKAQAEVERLGAIVDVLLPVAQVYVDAFGEHELMTLPERLRLQQVEDILADRGQKVTDEKSF